MTSELPIRTTLRLQLETPADLRAALFVRDDSPGVFVPDHLHLETGTELDVELTVREPAASIKLRGRVQWKRESATGTLRPGIGVAFVEDAPSARDLLHDFAEGRRVELHHRQAKRFPVMIDVQYRSRASFLSDLTDDLSMRGAFIATRETFTPGTRIQLNLQPPGRLFGIRVDAVVRWCQRDQRTGIGVEFLFANERARQQMEKLIAEVEAQMEAELGLAND